jgi:general secretion pathway protein L
VSVREGLIVVLPDGAVAQPQWMHVLDGAVVQRGTGTRWLEACGLQALADDCVVMLVPPAALTTLHWVSHPGMPARQGRAAARMAALADAIAPAETLLAATDTNEDPARPHVVALVARLDMQHWLLWAEQHGLDPDILVPAALLLPEPVEGEARAFVAGEVGGVPLLRGRDSAFPADEPFARALTGDAPVSAAGPDAITAAAIAALAAAPLNLRQGEFARRVRLAVDRRQLTRIAVWGGLIALASLLIALTGILRYHYAASRLDTESLALAGSVLPDAQDPNRVVADLDQRLAERGAGAYTFTGPFAGLLTAMQGTPSVSLSRLSRGADGLLTATLASARAEDINTVLLALQSAGFSITATSSQDNSGRVLADVTVRP